MRYYFPVVINFYQAASKRRITKASNIQSVEILQAIHRAEK